MQVGRDGRRGAGRCPQREQQNLILLVEVFLRFEVSGKAVSRYGGVALNAAESERQKSVVIVGKLFL